MSLTKNALNQAKWLNAIVHLACLLPLALLLWAAVRGELGINPVESVLQRTGRIALVILLLSLTATPINKIFHLRMVGRLRKPLGLYAAFYAVLHFAVFAIWDYELNIPLLWREMTEKPFILLGLVALMILVVLAITSLRYWRLKLGKWWSRLHQLVYLAGIFAILHYLLAVKGNLLNLQGPYTWPLIAAGVLVLLFILRIPAVNQFLHRLVTDR